MNGGHSPRLRLFGLSLAVAIGWYATVIVAVLVGWSGAPAAPDRDCSAVFSCLTPLESIGLLLIVSAPVLVGLLCVTLVVAALFARWISSPFVIGTLSALASVVLVAAAGLLWQGA
ncbi:hypothetical protein [Micromonospora sp. WMMD1082]|uniref:hypothetical protein n=1 Tax=Micromonospora sp. WMMD1082 TaxID=3016104 RepID=UPI0024178FA9|nr:hypothetical protein [Micromonospora sp. WMMD1082]MDG4798170.1 hypothetical protein [Micromonospora sp. WMMD1082]